MPTADDRPAVPAGNDADTLDQQIPAFPAAQDHDGPQAPVPGPVDPLRAEGSEADRLAQGADGGGYSDEDEYPRAADPHEE